MQQPLLYLVAYYYSYSFLYECPYGRKKFKDSLYIFHCYNKNIENSEFEKSE